MKPKNIHLNDNQLASIYNNFMDGSSLDSQKHLEKCILCQEKYKNYSSLFDSLKIENVIQPLKEEYICKQSQKIMRKIDFMPINKNPVFKYMFKYQIVSFSAVAMLIIVLGIIILISNSSNKDTFQLSNDYLNNENVNFVPEQIQAYYLWDINDNDLDEDVYNVSDNESDSFTPLSNKIPLGAYSLWDMDSENNLPDYIYPNKIHNNYLINDSLFDKLKPFSVWNMNERL